MLHAMVFHDVIITGAQQDKMKNLWEVENHAYIEQIQEFCTFSDDIGLQFASSWIIGHIG